MKVQTKRNPFFLLTVCALLPFAWFLIPVSLQYAIQPHAHAAAKTFTVNATGNSQDTNPGDGICLTSSGNCSLRAAIQEANANTGKDTIAFNIPGTGVQIISPGPNGLLDDITDPVIIDGSTQPGFNGSPLIEIEGSNAGNNVNALTITAGNSSVLHLIINRFDGSGIRITSAGGNTIQGNYIGTSAAGTLARANGGHAIIIQSNNNIIGGPNLTDRNILSGNSGQASGSTGLFVEGSFNTITNNYIGTDVTGTKALGNATGGIILSGSQNIIGTIGAGNLISGNGSGSAIALSLANANTISGNLIGTQADGVSSLPNAAGISIQTNSNSNSIGLETPGGGNVIANNLSAGVIVGTGCIGNGISGNSIFSNGLNDNSLGIDLAPSGLTPNDTGDGDSGANNLQNFPIITAATITSGSVNVLGTLNSVANKMYSLQFYSNTSCDPSGNGEGKTFLGSGNINTDGSGNASFNFNLGLKGGGQIITATATDPQGCTSEFSKCFTATAPGGLLQISQSQFSVNEGYQAVDVTVTRTGGSGAVSVDYATLDGTATQKGDYTFASGTLNFAAGETSKIFRVLINDDSLVEAASETFAVRLSNATGGAALGVVDSAIVNIFENDVPPIVGNSIDNAQNFVYQHYHDFLNREPDPSGLSFWTNNINSCGSNPQCVEVKRIDTSAAFFLSIEFQETGGFILRTQRAAFGHISSDATTRVTYQQFLRDSHTVGDGVVVLQSGWEAKLETNKQAYISQIVLSAEFANRYQNAQTADTLVDALFASAGVTPSAGDRQAAIVAFGAAGRVGAVRSVVDSNSMRTAELSPSFVLMQYFGYLRRNPTDSPDNNDSGYQFWLNKLNGFNGDFHKAEMVKAFISSGEYRSRFGTP